MSKMQHFMQHKTEIFFSWQWPSMCIGYVRTTDSHIFYFLCVSIVFYNSRQMVVDWHENDDDEEWANEHGRD
jgi:hypothetical protein